MENLIPMGQMDGCINTFSGLKINLINPKPEQISIYDIARGLSNNSHFGGHVPEFFSIAQHCDLVCHLMENENKFSQEELLCGLLHDASEAYLGDMVKPLKVHIPKFQKIEDNMQKVILEKFKIDPNIMPKIKKYDKDAQYLEFTCFYRKGVSFEHLNPTESFEKFMERFHKYSS